MVRPTPNRALAVTHTDHRSARNFVHDSLLLPLTFFPFDLGLRCLRFIRSPLGMVPAGSPSEACRKCPTPFVFVLSKSSDVIHRLARVHHHFVPFRRSRFCVLFLLPPPPLPHSGRGHDHPTGPHNSSAHPLGLWFQAERRRVHVLHVRERQSVSFFFFSQPQVVHLFLTNFDEATFVKFLWVRQPNRLLVSSILVSSLVLMKLFPSPLTLRSP